MAAVALGRYRVAVDIGGTFTDFAILDQETGQLVLEKTPTTPRDFWQGIARGLELAGIEPARIAMLVHGTTIGLNTFLERKGAPVGLITTHGFRDVYEIGRHNRVEMYDLFYRKPEPLVPREHRREVRERLDATGQVLVPLHEEDVAAAAEHFRRHGIRAIAVCLLHAYANPVHEERVGLILAELYSEAHVSLSHRLVREWREYERTSTTVINAYIAPAVSAYLERLEEGLARRGYRRPLFINKSTGGVMSVASARERPVHTIMSGPAGGAVAAAAIGREAGFPHVIAFDMGGTSTDVSIAWEGRLRLTADAQIDRHPVMVPMLDIHSIGAGGGSIAWIDAQGALHVGPQSAGAEPGPACYGRGGEEPTVTDANLLLGRLPPQLLGGAMPLYPDRAARAVGRVAEALGLSLLEAAVGIVRIVNTRMAYAIRAMTVQRGLDPKDFALMAYGGAGPMHACALAAELGIPTVVVPILPGAFSALGMLLSDLRHDAVRTAPVRTEEADPARVAGLFAEMEQELAEAVRAEMGDLPLAFERHVEMRYVGQEYLVSVPVPNGRPVDAQLLRELRHAFDRLHEQAYGHASTDEPTELVNLRVTCLGRLAPVQLPRLPYGGAEPPAAARAGTVEAYFEGEDGFIPCPVYRREGLLAGNRLRGPALVAEKGATTVIPPGFAVEVSPEGHLLIRGEG